MEKDPKVLWAQVSAVTRAAEALWLTDASTKKRREGERGRGDCSLSNLATRALIPNVPGILYCSATRRYSSPLASKSTNFKSTSTTILQPKVSSTLTRVCVSVSQTIQTPPKKLRWKN